MKEIEVYDEDFELKSYHVDSIYEVFRKVFTTTAKEMLNENVRRDHFLINLDFARGDDLSIMLDGAIFVAKTDEICIAIQAVFQYVGEKPFADLTTEDIEKTCGQVIMKLISNAVDEAINLLRETGFVIENDTPNQVN